MFGSTLNSIFEGALIGTILSAALVVIKITHEKNVMGERVKKARDQYEMAHLQYELSRDKKKCFHCLKKTFHKGKS